MLFRNDASGLPKEAHIDLSKFRANRKWAVLSNFSGYCLFFGHAVIKKCTAEVAISLGFRRQSVVNLACESILKSLTLKLSLLQHR